MSASEGELLALVTSWRRRAREFRREAEESRYVRDINLLAGMASSLDFAARELYHAVGIDPSARPPVANLEADRARLETDKRLARDSKEPKP